MSVSRACVITFCSMLRSSTRASEGTGCSSETAASNGSSLEHQGLLPLVLDEPDAIAGREFFDRWYKWAIRSRLEPMKKVAKMLKNRLDTILSWFRHRITNSNAEGFNSRIQAIKSNARGFNPSRTTELASSSSAETGPQTRPKLPLNYRKNPESKQWFEFAQCNPLTSSSTMC